MKSQLIKKLVRRSGYAVLALAALLALFILEENLRGHIMLARYKAELHAKGEKLTLAEIDLPKVPTEGNGAPALLEAADQLAAFSKNKDTYSSLELQMVRFVAPGHALVLCRQEDLVDWDKLHNDLTAVSNTLEKARTAARLPTLSIDLDYAKDLRGQPMGLMETRFLQHWLAASAVDALHRGDLDAALESIVAMVRLTQLQEYNRVEGVQGLRLWTAAFGLKVTWEALQADGWADGQLAQLQESWQEAECLPDFVPSMEMDRVECLQYYSRDTLKDLLDGLKFVSYYNEDLQQGFDYRIDTSLLTAHWLVWRAAWYEQDKLRCLRQWSTNLNAARAVVKHKSWTAWAVKRERRWTFYDPWRYLLYDASYDCSSDMERAVKYETLREMTIAAIALKRFQLRTEKLPTDLSVLVPEFLPQLPHDWMDGKPLRYKLNADGTFKLYSVGEDGIDDGGDASPQSVPWWIGVWTARDEVWPVPATPEQIQMQKLKWATRGEPRGRRQAKEPK